MGIEPRSTSHTALKVVTDFLLILTDEYPFLYLLLVGFPGIQSRQRGFEVSKMVAEAGFSPAIPVINRAAPLTVLSM